MCHRRSDNSWSRSTISDLLGIGLAVVSRFRRGFWLLGIWRTMFGTLAELAWHRLTSSFT